MRAASSISRAPVSNSRMTEGSVSLIFKDPCPSLFTRASTSMPESRTRPSRLSHGYFLSTSSFREVLEQDMTSPATSPQTRINRNLGFMFLPSFLACRSRPACVLSFVGEKPFLSPAAASIPDQPAAASDDPLTRDADGNGIPVVGLADGSYGLRPPDHRGHFGS